MINRTAVFCFMSLVVLACSGAPAPPAELQRGETCRWCRMAVSDARFAAQFSATEPLFFDDIGCMQHFLRDPKTALAVSLFTGGPEIGTASDEPDRARSGLGDTAGRLLRPGRRQEGPEVDHVHQLRMVRIELHVDRLVDPGLP